MKALLGLLMTVGVVGLGLYVKYRFHLQAGLWLHRGYKAVRRHQRRRRG